MVVIIRFIYRVNKENFFWHGGNSVVPRVISYFVHI